MPELFEDTVRHPKHYEIYPVQPIEITRHLGFCLGNAAKYVLRAPYKGGVEDCDKAIRYLEWERVTPQAPLICRRASLFAALNRLMNWLDESDGDDLWHDISNIQFSFLSELKSYIAGLDIPAPINCSLMQMLFYTSELSRVLALRDTTGQIYEGMSGLPEREAENE